MPCFSQYWQISVSCQGGLCPHVGCFCGPSSHGNLCIWDVCRPGNAGPPGVRPDRSDVGCCGQEPGRGADWRGAGKERPSEPLGYQAMALPQG